MHRGALSRQPLHLFHRITDGLVNAADLKPENLIFADKTDDAALLIADFGRFLPSPEPQASKSRALTSLRPSGLSRIIQEDQFKLLTTTCGTPGYMAPEIFRKSGHGKPVDLWAIGVIS